MPYKDPAKRREQQKLYKQKLRKENREDAPIIVSLPKPKELFEWTIRCGDGIQRTVAITEQMPEKYKWEDAPITVSLP